MLWTYSADTLTELHDMMTLSLVTAKESELDIVSTVDVQRHAVMGMADSMDWSFDLKTLWLTKSRWTMMIKQYLDPEELQRWIELCTSKIGTRGRGTAVMRTKIVKPRGGAATGHANKETRRWGSCMLSLSYKALPTPTITLHSRTSYLGYIGALDLSVAWMCARYLAEEMNMDVKQFSFVWMIESIQWHNFKSMAFLLNNPDPDIRKQYRRLLVKNVSSLTTAEQECLDVWPALKLSRKWLTKVRKEDQAGMTYGDMTYNTYRRIRRRWHTEVLGYEKAQTYEGWSVWKKGDKVGQNKEYFKAYLPLPSIPIETLDFKLIGMPLGKKYGAAFDGSFEQNEEDDDDE